MKPGRRQVSTSGLDAEERLLQGELCSNYAVY